MYPMHKHKCIMDDFTCVAFFIIDQNEIIYYIEITKHTN